MDESLLFVQVGTNKPKEIKGEFFTDIIFKEGGTTW